MLTDLSNEALDTLFTEGLNQGLDRVNGYSLSEINDEITVRHAREIADRRAAAAATRHARAVQAVEAEDQDKLDARIQGHATTIAAADAKVLSRAKRQAIDATVQRAEAELRATKAPYVEYHDRIGHRRIRVRYTHRDPVLANSAQRDGAHFACHVPRVRSKHRRREGRAHEHRSTAASRLVDRAARSHQVPWRLRHKMIEVVNLDGPEPLTAAVSGRRNDIL